MEKVADIRRRLKKEKELAIAKYEWQEYKYGKYDYVPIPDWLIPYFNKFWDAEELERIIEGIVFRPDKKPVAGNERAAQELREASWIAFMREYSGSTGGIIPAWGAAPEALSRMLSGPDADRIDRRSPSGSRVIPTEENLTCS